MKAKAKIQARLNEILERLMNCPSGLRGSILADLESIIDRRCMANISRKEGGEK